MQFLLLHLLSVLALPVGQAPVEFTPARLTGAAQVHSYCDDRTPVVVELAQGALVKEMEVRLPWSRIQVPGGLTLWVHEKYVDLEGQKGTLNARYVNARPLPSTGPESYPLGKFKQGDAVYFLDREGPWLKVVAPEEISGWVLKSHVEEVSASTSQGRDWERLWKQSREARRKAMGVGVPSKAVPAAAARKQPGQPTQPEFARSSGRAQPRTGRTEVRDSALTKAAKGTEVPNSSKSNFADDKVVVQQSFAETESILKKAENDLKRIKAGSYSKKEADRLEKEFARVLWTALDEGQLARAQAGLNELDGVRAATGQQLGTLSNPQSTPTRPLSNAPAQEISPISSPATVAQNNQAHIQKADTSLSTGTMKKETPEVRLRKSPHSPHHSPIVLSTKRPPKAKAGQYDVTGWVDYRPKASPKYPFVLKSGKQHYAIESGDGRFNLKNYVGREVALRGKWRTAGQESVQVLNITYLRLLPKKSK